jgi:hypothetical protein
MASLSFGQSMPLNHASASLPWNCSGAMYCTVPTSAPEDVNGDCGLGEDMVMAAEPAGIKSSIPQGLLKERL